MPAAGHELLRRHRRHVRGFSVAQRTIAIIGVAALVLGIDRPRDRGSTQPSYTPLFTGLAAADAIAHRRPAARPTACRTSSPTAARRSSCRRRRSTTSASRPPRPACRRRTTGGYSLLDKMGVTLSSSSRTSPTSARSRASSPRRSARWTACRPPPCSSRSRRRRCSCPRRRTRPRPCSSRRRTARRSPATRCRRSCT